MSGYLGSLQEALRAAGVPAEPLVTKSNGGVMSAEQGKADCAQMIDKCLSAPDSLKFDIFDALSDNRWRWRDTTHSQEVLGWKPDIMSGA